MTRFHATYLIETPLADADGVARMAAAMAGEQSTATFTRIAGETEALIDRHGAWVEAIELLEETDRASLPSHAHRGPGRFRRARVKLSWPLENIGHSLPMLATTLLGNQAGMRDLTGIRLEHLELPAPLLAACPRPAFGIAGTRRLAGLTAGPMIGTIVKPNIGLKPAETGALVATLAEAGLDFVKDDELIADPPYSPAEARIEAVLGAARRVAERSGRMIMYAANITGEVDEMRRRHDVVLAAGGTCVMVNINAVGLSGLLALRRHSQLPIHAHRAGWAALSRGPLQGLGFQPYQLMWRLAGADQMHVGGLGGKFYEDADSVIASTRACLTPMLDAGDRAMPVSSGGATVRHVRATLEMLGGEEVILLAGGAVLGHPGGAAAGVQSMRAAGAAALADTPIEEAARYNPALAVALAHWPAPASRAAVP
jgi:ribulose-bisphosphate carboxylase large chain